MAQYEWEQSLLKRAIESHEDHGVDAEELRVELDELEERQRHADEVACWENERRLEDEDFERDVHFAEDDLW